MSLEEETENHCNANTISPVPLEIPPPKPKRKHRRIHSNFNLVSMTTTDRVSSEIPEIFSNCKDNGHNSNWKMDVNSSTEDNKLNCKNSEMIKGKIQIDRYKPLKCLDMPLVEFQGQRYPPQSPTPFSQRSTPELDTNFDIKTFSKIEVRRFDFEIALYVQCFMLHEEWLFTYRSRLFKLVKISCAIAKYSRYLNNFA